MLTCILLTLLAHASEPNLPSFDDGLPPYRGEVALAPIGDVRVQIFPHLGKYSTPQGRESRFDQVSLSSAGTCKLKHAGGQVEVGKPGQVWEFRHAGLADEARLECDYPVTVHRLSPLQSFTYSGAFLIRPEKTESGQPMVQVINILAFDSYLKGVVPTEVPAGWALEALKVQAVAARSYGLWEVLAARENFPDRPYDVDDTIQYQAYLGLSKATAQTDQAVELTAMEVLTFEGKVIKAYFFSDSGGHTEDAANVFLDMPAPYCKAQKEVYDPSLVPGPWSATVTLEQLNQKLAAGGIISSSNPVQSLLILDSERFPSGRVSRVHLTLSSGAKKIVLATDLRYQLGLRSTLFTPRVVGSGSGKKYVFEGQGYGHGAGMSQWGTRALVEGKGWDYRQVLFFYYADVELGESKAD